MSLERTQRGRIRIDPIACPPLASQECRVVFRAVADTDFNENTIRGPNPTKNLMYNAIFIPLRIKTPSIFKQSLGVFKSVVEGDNQKPRHFAKQPVLCVG
jgi:hypothetical protein